MVKDDGLLSLSKSSVEAINAKNRYGGYTGFRQHYLFIRNGQAEKILAWPPFPEPWYH